MVGLFKSGPVEPQDLRAWKGLKSCSCSLLPREKVSSSYTAAQRPAGQALPPCKAGTGAVQNPGLGPSLSDQLGTQLAHLTLGPPAYYSGGPALGNSWLYTLLGAPHPLPLLHPWAICFVSSCLVSPSLVGLKQG